MNNGAHSGKFGVVNGNSTVRNWNVNETMAPAPFIASNTKGGRGRKRGIKDFTGGFQHYGGIPTVMPGDVFQFKGFTAPDNDQPNGTGTVIQGNAIVDNIAVTWNWSNGEAIQTQVNFSGDGALEALDSQAALLDNTNPQVQDICGGRIEVCESLDPIGSTSGYGSLSGGCTPWENLEQVVLTISADNQSYVNSSTNCWTRRKPGPIDWALAVTEQETARHGGIFDKIRRGNHVELNLYVDATQYWWLQWGIVHDFTGLNVDRETGAIISRTVNLAMSGFVNNNAGRIRVPGASSNWWPVAGA